MSETQWRYLCPDDVIDERCEWEHMGHGDWEPASESHYGRRVRDVASFLSLRWRAPVAPSPDEPDAPTPPDGYEIVDREDESGTEVDSRTWLICYPERPSCTGWRRPGTGAGLWSVSEFPHDAVLARPIRKPAASPWVLASERQPPSGVIVANRVTDGAWCGCVGVAPIMHGLEWLDLDGVDRLAAENDRLREELVNEREISGARIAKLQAERDAKLQAELDAKLNRAANNVRGCCSDCRFFDGKADMGGNCHRHPQARPIAFPELHWCGEFDPKEATLS